jgi:hypothetical protein
MSDILTVLSGIFQKAQILTSAEAELVGPEPRWIFEAQTFQAGAGDYVVIRVDDWDAFVKALRATHMTGDAP